MVQTGETMAIAMKQWSIGIDLVVADVDTDKHRVLGGARVSVTYYDSKV
jgi:hypothetical protein